MRETQSALLLIGIYVCVHVSDGDGIYVFYSDRQEALALQELAAQTCTAHYRLAFKHVLEFYI